MADRFEDLRNFVAIAESGGVNAAATRLGIAKSAVSRRLAEFEQRLGAQLAERSGRRFALTSVGATVLADAQRILADLDRLEANATRTDHALPLTVGADRDLLELVATAATGLRDGKSAIDVAIGERDGAAAGPVALTFTTTIGEPGAGQVVGRSRRCVYARRGAPVLSGPADLRGVDAVSVATAGPEEWRFDRVEVAPRAVMTVPDVRTGLAAAAAGGMVVRAPEWSVASGPWRDLLVEVMRPRSADLAVVAERIGEADVRADRLIDLVYEALRPAG